MPIKSFFISIVCLLSSTLLLPAQSFNIIPIPSHLVAGQGTFLLSRNTSVWVQTPIATTAAQYLTRKINRATGFSLHATTGKTGKSGILLRLSSTPLPAEGYVLHVDRRGIELEAGDASGFFYGVQTLLQLLPPSVEGERTATDISGWEVPVVNIEDAPRFAYRGVMLDPCRHFLSVEEIKREIDLLSSYKINRLHWHLTDDQGWRIEIKKYPQLTAIGAWRTEADGTRHGGYYTQEEVREVVAYAAEHAMEVVPELEVPGHELAAIAALPELSCKGETTTPRIIWGVEETVMCPGKETMFNFLRDVIDEMTALFPSRLFHIGGDECPRTEWGACPQCQQRMKSLGYTREAQLQSYVVERVARYLKKKGKTAIGWDEVLEGGNLPKEVVVMSWRGVEGATEAVKAGHPVILSPASDGCYFDYLQGDLVTEPIAFSVYGDLRMTYGLDPVAASQADEAQRPLVMGVQGNCWSEYIHNPQHLEYKIFPRALALAEVGWSPQEKRDFDHFCRRLDSDAALRLQARGVNFHIPLPEQPGKKRGDWASCNKVVFMGDSTTLSLTTTRPLDIVYTLDGSQPSARSPRYTGPIRLHDTRQVRTRCVLPCGILGPERTIDVLRETPRPTIPSGTTAEKGIKVRYVKGNFTYANGAQAPFDRDTVVSTFADVTRLTPLPKNMRGVEHYTAMAETLIDIPTDGVYEWTTHNACLWIDDELLVDNRAVFIPRNSLQPAQIALRAGRHRVRTLFVGGIFQGWPTYWDEGFVRFRKIAE